MDMGGIVISYDSGVINGGWEEGEGGEGGVAERGDREMGKGRTGRYLSIWMFVSECGGKGEGGVGY